VHGDLFPPANPVGDFDYGEGLFIRGIRRMNESPTILNALYRQLLCLQGDGVIGKTITFSFFRAGLFLTFNIFPCRGVSVTRYFASFFLLSWRTWTDCPIVCFVFSAVQLSEPVSSDSPSSGVQPPSSDTLFSPLRRGFFSPPMRNCAVTPLQLLCRFTEVFFFLPRPSVATFAFPSSGFPVPRG